MLLAAHTIIAGLNNHFSIGITQHNKNDSGQIKLVVQRRRPLRGVMQKIAIVTEC